MIDRVICTGRIFSQRCQNVLHFDRANSNWTEVEYVNNILSDWLLFIRQLQNNNFQWTQISVQLGVSEVNPGVPLVFDISNQLGGLSGKPAPSFVAGILSLRTGFAGRSGRGRIYLPGIHDDSIANGQLEAGALQAFVNNCNTLKLRWCSGGSKPVRLVVWSRNRDDGPREVVNILPRQVFGIQRRRNIGVGA